ncbi:3' terminal RNA ribose 2'-O-methyltransferase Hen1 [Deinococcus yavapaiensis]|uniref:Small RNA 2'-O-methyltransferase n=1 Tax=Deinococcus yavapaiensis KR-236 TaxID=694435 RepID=A0A318SP44_9DEIO|nr:3' terminal RNA ribose 2'-O-methyltransferase Hen1 [Deinococcus yavapaiensis]PYE54520.1 3' terminal RNA ribose 2'-O-methyltransferase Hen1 [Deinococcus yavapaiensis KR-236]
MLLTISTTHHPATDLGFLLHKHPGRLHTSSLAFGAAHVFYPEATEQKCTAALLLEVDPVALSRRTKTGRTPLEPYVNDRPYVPSSLLSVALRDVFGTALSGRSKERQALADAKIPLRARLTALPSRGDPDLIRRLFSPLGYNVDASPLPLDDTVPEWGNSPYADVSLGALIRLRDLLAHLYVLVPVLDDAKHYFVDETEIDKLLRHGEGWLDEHPERDFITSRFLRYKRHLQRAALQRLEVREDEDVDEDGGAEVTEAATKQPSLHARRLDAVTKELLASSGRRVLDLGCGEGKLIVKLLDHPQFTEILGMDVDSRALRRADERLARLPEAKRSRVRLIQGSLTYRDKRLRGFDAAALVEVIEHLDEPRLAALERAVFVEAKPRSIVVTTPNQEYNARFETLAAGEFRHEDHRFEWARAQFRTWAEGLAERHRYSVRFAGIGDEDEEVGPPSQMAVFTRKSAEDAKEAT